jgi:hypothetical protein
MASNIAKDNTFFLGSKIVKKCKVDVDETGLPKT